MNLDNENKVPSGRDPVLTQSVVRAVIPNYVALDLSRALTTAHYEA